MAKKQSKKEKAAQQLIIDEKRKSFNQKFMFKLRYNISEERYNEYQMNKARLR